MTLITRPYREQVDAWPPTGRHIMAQYDDSTVVVYQAFRPSIARFAVKNQRFGGDFSFDRMSWIKPNFLWMMFRCGWGTKADQESVLAVRLKREAFDEILGAAVHTAYVADQYASLEVWGEQLRSSSVRLQWDPDHDPTGARVDRRAIQLGLSGEMLRRYATDSLVEVEDISDFVAAQRQNAAPLNRAHLVIPLERPYRPGSQATVLRLGLDASSGAG